MPYHHGDLRRTLLDHALAAVAANGPAGVSLRDVARRAGVSHAAPTHHFRDKTGLLTALAAEGWSLLGDELARTAAGDSPDFSEMGVSYVLFATSHPAHFAVMRAPGLVRRNDPELAAAEERSGRLLRAGARRHPDPAAATDATTALAGWALVHGLSALLLEGSIAPQPGSDVATLARSITRKLGPG